MKPFRYGLDPLCLVASGLYAINRWWLSGRLGGNFLTGHFNDLLLIPAALPWVLWIHAKLDWRPYGQWPTAREIAGHVLVWSVVCEGIAPRLLPTTTADFRDVICYAVGGLAAAMAWRWGQRRPDLVTG